MTTYTVQLRDRRQITQPAEIVAAAGLRMGDTLAVRWAPAAGIVMVPTQAGHAPPLSVHRFIGAARGVYASQDRGVEEADACVRRERASW
jgi:bifunctional DNA-binding transcriptional regulator/antitoxin component of YhaV-PrlF toxin-antitoxin module